MEQNKRIESVDVLRGLTMAMMILVNNPGSWSRIYAPLRHAQWNGMTPTDCVFPVFLFLMGYSIFLSFRKSGFTLSGKLWGRIIKRSVLLFAIGIILTLPSILAGRPVRILGVLQRFALCYLVAAPLVCLVPHEKLPWLAAILLIGYWVLLAFGHGFERDASNILVKVDTSILGKHSYNDHGLDPEGILSTIPAIAHTLIGFCAAKCMIGAPSGQEGTKRILLLGAMLFLGGLLLQYGCPINKKIWSPTFTISTCGIGCLLLGLLTSGIDETGKIKHTGFWKVFGTNSILCYILASVYAWLLSSIRIAGNSIGGWLNSGLTSAFSDGPFASLLYAIVMVMLIWITVLPLYRKGKFIRL